VSPTINGIHYGQENPRKQIRVIIGSVFGWLGNLEDRVSTPEAVIVGVEGNMNRLLNLIEELEHLDRWPLTVDEELVDKARDFAYERHRGAMYGQHTYTYHLTWVCRILSDAGFSDTYLAAGWLHDVLEDTDTTYSQLRTVFGNQVADLVQAVTVPAKVGNREARTKQAIEQLKAFPAAIPLKLADRIANVQHCWETKDARLFMYVREYPKFRELRGLEPDGTGSQDMWAQLDELHGQGGR